MGSILRISSMANGCHWKVVSWLEMQTNSDEIKIYAFEMRDCYIMFGVMSPVNGNECGFLPRLALPIANCNIG